MIDLKRWRVILIRDEYKDYYRKDKNIIFNMLSLEFKYRNLNYRCYKSEKDFE